MEMELMMEQEMEMVLVLVQEEMVKPEELLVQPLSHSRRSLKKLLVCLSTLH